MAIAEKHAATISLATAHRITGWTLGLTGNIAEGRERLDQALALHDPSERRRLATHRPASVSFVASGAVPLVAGYPEAAQADIDHAVREAREIGQASTLMFALAITNYTNVICRNAVAVIALSDELIALANEKGASLRKAEGAFHQGCGLALTGRFAEAAMAITAAITVWRSTGATCWSPLYRSFLADVHARLGQFDDARRCIDEAIAASAASKETWCDADINRIAGEIELLSGEADTKKAQAYFERALAIARRQKAKSFELRAGDEHGAALAGSGKTATGPRSTRPDLRLVHRRLRDARPERSQGPARYAGGLRPGDFRIARGGQIALRRRRSEMRRFAVRRRPS